MDRRLVHQVPTPSKARTSRTPATGQGDPAPLCCAAASAPAGAAGSVCSGTTTPAGVPVGEGLAAGGVAERDAVVAFPGVAEGLVPPKERVGADVPTTAGADAVRVGAGGRVGVGVGSATSAAHSVLG